jgi:hypothetical protein
MNKFFYMIMIGSLISSGCSTRINNTSSDPNTLPNVNLNGGSGQTYTIGRAEFDASVSGDGTASFQLVKKSYASGTCSHGACIDYTDITVSNATQTIFSLTQGGTTYTPTATNDNLGTITTLTIGTLFDNDLFACSGQKCTTAAINIYTSNANGGSGLYNSVNGQSIPLLVTGPLVSTPTAVPYLQPNELTLNNLLIPGSMQVVSLANGNFASDSYPLKADFTKAGVGTYKAHVVVEYDLIGPSISPYTFTENTLSTAEGGGLFGAAIDTNGNTYALGTDSSNDDALWVNGTKVLLPSSSEAGSGGVFGLYLDSNNILYVAGQDSAGNYAVWVGNVGTNSPTNPNTYLETTLNLTGFFLSFRSIVHDNNGIVYIGAFETQFSPTFIQQTIVITVPSSSLTGGAVNITNATVYNGGISSFPQVSTYNGELQVAGVDKTSGLGSVWSSVLGTSPSFSEVTFPLSTNNLYGLASDSLGNLYAYTTVTNGACQIVEQSTGGTITTIPVPNCYDNIQTSQIIIDSSNNIYILGRNGSTTANYAVFVTHDLSTFSTFTLLSPTGETAGAWTATSMAMGSTGIIYVTGQDLANGSLFSWTGTPQF